MLFHSGSGLPTRSWADPRRSGDSVSPRPSNKMGESTYISTRLLHGTERCLHGPLAVPRVYAVQGRRLERKRKDWTACEFGSPPTNLCPAATTSQDIPPRKCYKISPCVNADFLKVEGGKPSSRPSVRLVPLIRNFAFLNARATDDDEAGAGRSIPSRQSVNSQSLPRVSAPTASTEYQRDC